MIQTMRFADMAPEIMKKDDYTIKSDLKLKIVVMYQILRKSSFQIKEPFRFNKEVNKNDINYRNQYYRHRMLFFFYKNYDWRPKLLAG